MGNGGHQIHVKRDRLLGQQGSAALQFWPHNFIRILSGTLSSKNLNVKTANKLERSRGTIPPNRYDMMDPSYPSYSICFMFHHAMYIVSIIRVVQHVWIESRVVAPQNSSNVHRFLPNTQRWNKHAHTKLSGGDLHVCTG